MWLVESNLAERSLSIVSEFRSGAKLLAAVAASKRNQPNVTRSHVDTDFNYGREKKKNGGNRFFLLAHPLFEGKGPDSFFFFLSFVLLLLLFT